MKSIYSLIVILLFTFTTACSKDSTNPPNDENPNESIEQALQELLDNTISTDPMIHNGVLLVEAPDRNLKWKSAAGLADPQTGEAMTVDHQFHSASVGKTPCAALVIRLSELGLLSLDDKITQHLPAEITNDLYIFQGQDYKDSVSVRQLLNHTSGLADHFADGDANGNGVTDFQELLAGNPTQFWTPQEVIAYAKANFDPLFAPGERYRYSDTGYILLGLIAESAAGKPYHEAMREHVLNPLGMTQTDVYLYHTPQPGTSVSHVFLGEIDYTNYQSISSDWSAGGLMTTAEDLNRFLRAFVRNDFFANPESKAAMTDWVNEGDPGLFYGLGISRIELGQLGVTGVQGSLIGHNGFSFVMMYYWPEQNVTITGSFNQAIPASTSETSLLLNILQLFESN